MIQITTKDSSPDQTEPLGSHRITDFPAGLSTCVMFDWVAQCGSMWLSVAHISPTYLRFECLSSSFTRSKENMLLVVTTDTVPGAAR